MPVDPAEWNPDRLALDLPEELLPQEPEFRLVEVKPHVRRVKIKKKTTKETADDQPDPTPSRDD